jgi:hypothetical protein
VPWEILDFDAGGRVIGAEIPDVRRLLAEERIQGAAPP